MTAMMVSDEPFSRGVAGADCVRRAGGRRTVEKLLAGAVDVWTMPG
jgi:hypothetical protein